VGVTVPIRHLGMKGEKTLNNLNSNNLKPNASKALLTHWIYQLIAHITLQKVLKGKYCPQTFFKFNSLNRAIAKMLINFINVFYEDKKCKVRLRVAFEREIAVMNLRGGHYSATLNQVIFN
jgi:hypothetical protein